MVDYAIYLEYSDQDRATDAIISLVKDEHHTAQSINHTMYEPLRFRPIAISVETKTSDGSESTADIQLGIWVAAHFAKLLLFMKENDRKTERLPVLPVLYIAGPHWSVQFAVHQGKGIVS